jgi:peptidoglycan LD-endopeptidase CwlK
MAFCLSKLSRDRLRGVRSDLVRVVERAIQITTQDFRVQEGCARE